MVSAICLNLDQSKILSSGNGIREMTANNMGTDVIICSGYLHYQYKVQRTEGTYYYHESTYHFIQIGQISRHTAVLKGNSSMCRSEFDGICIFFRGKMRFLCDCSEYQN